MSYPSAKHVPLIIALVICAQVVFGSAVSVPMPTKPVISSSRQSLRFSRSKTESARRERASLLFEPGFGHKGGNDPRFSEEGPMTHAKHISSRNERFAALRQSVPLKGSNQIVAVIEGFLYDYPYDP